MWTADTATNTRMFMPTFRPMSTSTIITMVIIFTTMASDMSRVRAHPTMTMTTAMTMTIRMVITTTMIMATSITITTTTTMATPVATAAHSVPVGSRSLAAVEPRNILVRAWSAILAVGIRPCSGAILILVFAVGQGMVWAGVAATFAMAVGTGLTVAILAALAVSAKDFAVRFAGPESESASWIVRTVEVAGAAAVMLFGLLLLGGALSGAGPT